jgi:MFS family permease
VAGRLSRAKPLALLFVVVFIDLLGFGMVIPLMARYARELGAPDAWIGLLSAGYSAMQFLFAPFWGQLSDRMGRRPTLIGSIAMTAVAFTLSGLVTSFPALLATRLFAGAATANIAIAQAYVADVTRPEERAKGMGVLGAAFGLGFILGPFAGGLLAGISLGAPFLAAGALAAVNAVAAFLILPEPQKREKAARPRRRRLEELREALSRPGVPRLLLVYFLSIAAFSAMESTFALLTADRYGLTDRQNGYVFGYIGFVMVLVQGGLVGPLTRRVGEVTLLGIGTAIMVVALVTLPFATGMTGLLGACAGLAIGNGLATPAITSLLSRLSRAEEQGEALGIGQSVAAMGRIVGPESGTLSFQASAVYPYVGGAALMAVASLVGWTIRAAPRDA